MISPKVESWMIVTKLSPHLISPLHSVILQLLSILNSLGAVIRDGL